MEWKAKAKGMSHARPRYRSMSGLLNMCLLAFHFMQFCSFRHRSCETMSLHKPCVPWSRCKCSLEDKPPRNASLPSNDTPDSIVDYTVSVDPCFSRAKLANCITLSSPSIHPTAPKAQHIPPCHLPISPLQTLACSCIRHSQ